MIKNLHIFAILIRTFGFRLKHIGIFFGRLFISLFIFITTLGDALFFPSTRKRAIDRPVFLIGHLRSGTTFLHRFLSSNCPQLHPFYLWQMVFPTLTARFLVKPFLKIWGNISFDRVYDPKIHKTGLMKAETDDIALSFRFFDGMLSWIYFYAWDDFSSDADLELQLTKVSRKEKFITYLKDVYRKNLYKKEGRMFSKSFSTLFSLDYLLKEFPDARVLLIVRNPLEAVPSMISLEKNVQNKLSSFEKQPEELKQKYYRNLYKTSLAYYRLFEKKAAEYQNDERVKVVTHKSLMTDFRAAILGVISFYGLEMTDDLLKAVDAQERKQREFRTEHAYSAEAFGLSEEMIRKDFDFIYRAFDL